MKKFRNLFRRWKDGEEIHFEGEVTIDLRHALVVLILFILAIVTIVRLFKGH